MDEIKLIVVLGEVGGTSEYEIVDAVKSKKITKVSFFLLFSIFFFVVLPFLFLTKQSNNHKP